MRCHSVKRGKWLLIVVGAMLLMRPASFASFGQEPPARLRETRLLSQLERDSLATPAETVEDGRGNRYHIEEWKLEPVETEVKHPVQKQVIYRQVEGNQQLPKQVPADTEQSEVGGLYLEKTEVLKESWQEDLEIPVIFHAYGAEQYQLGSLVLNVGETFPEPEAYAGELLELLDLDPAAYEVTEMSWKGDPYYNEEGELCREAQASGRRRLRDYRAFYQGELTEETTQYRLQTIYRLEEPEAPQLLQTTSAADERVTESLSPLEYWIRRGFVISVAAGLVGMVLGSVLLLVLWIKRMKGEKKRI